MSTILNKQELLKLFETGYDIDNGNYFISPTQFKDDDILTKYINSLIENHRLGYLISGCKSKDTKNILNGTNISLFNGMYNVKAGKGSLNFKELILKLNVKHKSFLLEVLDFANLYYVKSKATISDYNELLDSLLPQFNMDNSVELYNIFTGILGNMGWFLTNTRIMDSFTKYNFKVCGIPTDMSIIVNKFPESVNIFELSPMIKIKLKLLYYYDLDIDSFEISYNIDNILNELGDYNEKLYDIIKDDIYTEEYIKIFDYYYSKGNLNMLLYLIKNINQSNINMVEVVNNITLTNNIEFAIMLLKEILKQN